MLSTRSSVYLGEQEFLVKCFIKCIIDPEIINMGTAVNALCEDIMQERLQKDGLFTHEPAWQHYMGLNGTPDLLSVTANFLTERLGKVTLLNCLAMLAYPCWNYPGRGDQPCQPQNYEWGKRWSGGSSIHPL